jgi:hypothetical protein
MRTLEIQHQKYERKKFMLDFINIRNLSLDDTVKQSDTAD